jgi:hypothetical protein
LLDQMRHVYDVNWKAVTAALARAFHREALIAVEAELDTPQEKPARPEYSSMFSLSRR